MRLPLLGLLLGLLGFVSALSAAGSKLLVVLEQDTDKAKYSQFWADLESRGFSIDYKTVKDTSIALFNYGEPAYSHLLLLPVKTKGLGPALTPNIIVDFVNAGSNVLLALSNEYGVPATVNSLLLELDISLSPDKNSVVVDHWNYDSKSAADKHDTLLLASPSLKKGLKNYFEVDGLIAFPHAVGQVLGNESPLLSSVIRAPSTAYVYNEKEESSGVDEVFAPGSQINIVSAFQARNSARFVVLGSSESLEDTWFDATIQLPGSKTSQKSSNRQFAQKLSSWAFKESGVIKTGKIEHYLNEGATTSDIDLNPGIYRIKNNVHYSIEISEWQTDSWKPFVPAEHDHVQLEFSMLSPFHRLNLIPSRTTSNSTIFTSEFKLPDQHGIFNFFVEYRRPFLTNLEEKRTVTVRHFAHDEWPRSFVISGAYPWISGIWVTIAGWVAFVAVWLYGKPAQEKTNLKAAKR